MRTDTTDTERLLREGLGAALLLRRRRNRELAEKLNVRPSWVTAVLKGRHGIAPRHLDAIAQFLGVGVPDLMAGPDHIRQLLAERTAQTPTPEVITPAALMPLLDGDALNRLLGFVASLVELIKKLGGPVVELHMVHDTRKPVSSEMEATRVSPLTSVTFSGGSPKHQRPQTVLKRKPATKRLKHG